MKPIFERNDPDDMPTINAGEIHNIREDSRQILRTLEQSQLTNLSIHLYSSHLLHRNDHRFPRSSWTKWPASLERESSMNDDVEHRIFNHDVPVPSGRFQFTDFEPRLRSPLYVESSFSHKGRISMSREKRTSQKLKSFYRAQDCLLFEINATFQRTIYKRIHQAKQSSKLVPQVDVSPVLGSQSRHRVLEFVNRLLMKAADYNAEIVRGQRRRHTLNWKDLLQSESLTGKVYQRCKCLFIDNNEGSLKSSDYRMFNVMSQTERLDSISGYDSKPDLYEILCPDSNNTNQSVLLASTTVPVKGGIEFFELTERVKKSNISTILVNKRRKSMMNKGSLELLDDNLFSKASSHGIFSDTITDEDFCQDLVQNNTNQSSTAESDFDTSDEDIGDSDEKFQPQRETSVETTK